MNNKKTPNKGKKNNKNNKNQIPSHAEINKMKSDFKKMIDEMCDEEFLLFTCAVFELMDELENCCEEDEDGDWEFEVEDFDNKNSNIIYFNPNEDDELPF